MIATAITPTRRTMNLSKISRQLAELDKLETRINLTVNPSQVLIAEIKRQREALLNGKDPNATTQTQPGK